MPQPAKSPPVPILFPYDPAQFWGLLRQIIQEEIRQGNMQPKPIATTGLAEKPLYTIDELCSLFQISKPTVYDWTRHGELKPIKIRGRVYFLWSDLRELLQAHQQAARSVPCNRNKGQKARETS